MNEILNELSARSVVLDLGCARGSFPREHTAATVVRVDREVEGSAGGENVVQADAARLPFRQGTFDAIVSNHSLEHFDELDGCLREIGRTIRRDGALFVSVPDATTLTDRVYRWIARGGGHVNAFTAPEQVIRLVEEATGLRHVATRTLHSSMSFLHRANAPRRPRRLLVLGNGTMTSLWLYTWVSRRLDRLLSLRTSVYGWAFYFGRIPAAIETAAQKNVCIRCGSADASALLRAGHRVVRVRGLLDVYSCPRCGTTNTFIDD